MSKKLTLIATALMAGCVPQAPATEFRAIQPVTQALPIGLSTTVPVPWTDFITPNVTFEVNPDQVYEIWVKPGHASILTFPQDEFITSKSVSDPAHWFLSQAQPNHYTPSDHRLAVLASDANKSAMLVVFTQTRHYRIRVKSIDGSAFNQTVDWQLPRVEVQVASAAPFRPSDVPTGQDTSSSLGVPPPLVPNRPVLNDHTPNPDAPVQLDSDELAETQNTSEQRPQKPENPASQEWSVREGQTLSQVLTEWTVRAGYRLLPLPEQGWRLGVTDSFSGDFESALEWLFSGFAHADKRPVAVLHSNRVIEIKEEVE